MHPHPCCSHCPCHQPNVVLTSAAGANASMATTIGGLLTTGTLTLTVNGRDDPDDGVPAVVRR